MKGYSTALCSSYLLPGELQFGDIVGNRIKIRPKRCAATAGRKMEPTIFKRPGGSSSPLRLARMAFRLGGESMPRRILTAAAIGMIA